MTGTPFDLDLTLPVIIGTVPLSSGYSATVATPLGEVVTQQPTGGYLVHNIIIMKNRCSDERQSWGRGTCPPSLSGRWGTQYRLSAHPPPHTHKPSHTLLETDKSEHRPSP